MKQGLGNGYNGQFTFLDTLNIISFCVGLMNLDENLGQGDKQDILEEFSKKADDLLNEIHNHLQKQDDKIDRILEVLSNDSTRGIQSDSTKND
jgi:hypothetical protein